MRAQLLRFGLLMAFAGAWLGACASGSTSDFTGTLTNTTTTTTTTTTSQAGGHGGSGQGAGGNGGAGGVDVCASASNGTPCGDPSEPVCDLSACAGGVCVPATAPLDTPCGSPVDTECDPADGCDGAGSCEARIAAVNTPCGDAGESSCDHADSCDGQGTCLAHLEAANTPCGAPDNTTCTDPDSCDAAGVCQPRNASDGLACNDCQSPPCTTCLGGVCSGNCANGLLTTTYASNNGFDGNMFDVVALQSIVVTSFDVNVDVGAHTMEVYYRAGTWVGFDLSSAGWTLVGSAAVNAAAADQATPVPLPVNLAIPAGQRYAFYITTTGGGMKYTDGTGVGTVAAQNADLQILQGNGNQYAFLSGFTPRIWNGTLHYQACP